MRILLLMPAGLWARKLSREIEIDERGIRETRDGQLVDIRWDEPHELTHEVRVVKNKGLTVSGQARVTVRAAEDLSGARAGAGEGSFAVDRPGGGDASFGRAGGLSGGRAGGCALASP